MALFPSSERNAHGQARSAAWAARVIRTSPRFPSAAIAWSAPTMDIVAPEHMAPRNEAETLVLVLTLLRWELEHSMPSDLCRELLRYAQLLATTATGTEQ